MPHPILQAIQSWLKHHKDIEADLENGRMSVDQRPSVGNEPCTPPSRVF